LAHNILFVEAMTDEFNVVNLDEIVKFYSSLTTSFEFEFVYEITIVLNHQLVRKQ